MPPGETAALSGDAMADVTQVINSALGLLGASRITSLEDGSELAALAGVRYPIARDAVLEAHPWNFAMVRASLGLSGTTPAFDWNYQFPLPTTPWCIKVRDTNDEGSGWEVGYDPVDERVLLSNNNTMQIRYTARVDNLNIWSPLAVMALTYLLAADFAVAIAGQGRKVEPNQQRFADMLTLAMTSDSREGSPVVVQAPTTLTTDIR